MLTGSTRAPLGGGCAWPTAPALATFSLADYPSAGVRSVTKAALVVFPGALGDFICFLPTLHALRGQYEGTTVAVVVQVSLLPLAVRPGLADQGAALESAAVARLFVGGATQASPVPGTHIGDVYSWFGTAEPVVRENLMKLAGGRVRCARFAPPAEHEGHVARWFLRSAGLSPASASTGTHIPLRGGEKEGAEEFWHRHGLAGRAVLAVHRGAGNRAKRWTDDGYEAVTRWWRGRGGAVLEVAGTSDPDELLAPGHSVARGLALGDVAALLARADLYVGSDTGVSHLAGAVGTRGVVVFGPTRALAWRPLGGRLVCLNSLLPLFADEPISLCAVSSTRVIRALDLLASAKPNLDKE